MSTKYRTNETYSLLAKSLHWCFIILFAYGIFKQIEDINELEDSSLLRFEILFAAVFLLFLLFRFFYMTITQKSSLPAKTSRFHKVTAKVVHILMYLNLAGIAVSGLLIGYLYWLDYKEGLLITFMIWTHESFVSVIYWLISIHVLAAIYHRLRNDGVWSSMVPFWKEKEN